MASQVPYYGTQEITPQVDPLSTVHVDTPVAAFGGDVAHAITHMGEVTEGAGKELFDRAYAMQEYDEFQRADAAAAEYNNKSTQLLLNLDSLQGKEREDAFPKYQADLNTLRTDTLSAHGIKSPYAMRQYDDFTRRVQSQYLMHGGMIAKEGMNAAGKQAGLDLIDSLGNTLATMSDPAGANKESYEAGLKTLTKATAIYARDYGGGYQIGTPENDREATRLISGEIAKVVAAVDKNPNNADKAKKLMDDMFSRGLLHPLDAAKISPRVNYDLDAKVPVVTAHEVTKGLKGWDDYTAPDDVAAAGLSAGAMTQGSYNSISNPLPNGSHQVGKYGVNSSILKDNLEAYTIKNEAGSRVTTEEDFLKSPAAQEQFRKEVFPGIQKISGGSFKSALNTWYGVDDPTHTTAAMAAIARNADPTEIDTRTRKVQADKDPSNPGAEDAAADNAKRLTNQAKQAEFLANQLKRHAVMAEVDGENSKDGRVPISREEALKNKDFADGYAGLDKPSRDAVDKIIEDNNKLGGVRESDYNIRLTDHYKQIWSERDTPRVSTADLTELAEVDLLKLPLTKEQRSNIRGWQHDVINQVVANPNITHAMSIPDVTTLLNKYGITKEKDPAAYEKFKSKFYDAIKEYGFGAERTPKNDTELFEIAKKLVDPDQVWWGGYGNQPYESITKNNPAAKRKGEEEFYKKYGRSAVPDDDKDDDEIERLSLQRMFQELGRTHK
jgi:hypothetical protein